MNTFFILIFNILASSQAVPDTTASDPIVAHDIQLMPHGSACPPGRDLNRKDCHRLHRIVPSWKKANDSSGGEDTGKYKDWLPKCILVNRAHKRLEIFYNINGKRKKHFRTATVMLPISSGEDLEEHHQAICRRSPSGIKDPELDDDDDHGQAGHSEPSLGSSLFHPTLLKQAFLDCNKPCTRDCPQVCGSNGKTYCNKCILENTACKTGKNITVNHGGECKGNGTDTATTVELESHSQAGSAKQQPKKTLSDDQLMPHDLQLMPHGSACPPGTDFNRKDCRQLHRNSGRETWKKGKDKIGGDDIGKYKGWLPKCFLHKGTSMVYYNYNKGKPSQENREKHEAICRTSPTEDLTTKNRLTLLTRHVHAQVNQWKDKKFRSSEEEDCPKRSKSQVKLVTKGMTLVTKGANTFGSLLFKDLTKSQNLVFSPFSLSTGLAMLTPGAKGETLKQITGSLSLPSSLRDIMTGYRCILPTFRSEDSSTLFTLLTANRIFLKKGFQPEEGFLNLLEKNFHSSTQALDFLKKDAAAKAINDWVAAETGDKINDLINPDSLDQGTMLVLVNAIYFKAEWKYKFDKKLTEGKDFYLEGETKKVPMMHLGGASFEAAKIPALRSTMLRLPYKGDRIVLDILLPNVKEEHAEHAEHAGGYVSVEEVEKTLRQTEILQEFEGKKLIYEVAVNLPKFKIESTHSDLEKALKANGLTDMWCDGLGKPDFSGIGSDLCVSKVIQKAMIEVDEEGAEAAAATAIMMAFRSEPASYPKMNFTADHPFLFFLRDLQTGMLLFQGRVVDPTGGGRTKNFDYHLLPKIEVSPNHKTLTD